ncbi:tyrosine-type recombinase/integrase [Paracoccus zhejiangensis]|nr:tyrosine-type recombinase/integrase [Paracoccus zhejiangensis]
MPSQTSDFRTAISTLAVSAREDGIDPRDIARALLEAALSTGIRRELRSTVSAALEQAKGAPSRELTDLQCRRLRAGQRLTDPQYAGLVLVASTRGSRWIYRSQANGRQRQATIGRYPAISLAEAREKWAVMRSEGLDVKSADTRSTTTLEALADKFITAQQAKGRRSWQRTQKVLAKHLLAHHGGMTLGEVAPEALENCYLHLMDTQPGAAHNIKASISAMFGWAHEQRLLPTGMQAMKLRKAPKAQVKEYYPGPADLRTMLGGLAGMNPADAAIIRFQLLTGTRISEAREAVWSEIDLSERRWTIPAARMKAKRPHTVMLSNQALALLTSQTTREGRIFGHRAHETTIKAWAKRRAELKLPDEYGTHCHRKSLLTWVAEHGGGRDIRDRLSAHSRGTDSDSHYQLSTLNREAGEWWQRWADRIDAIEEDGKVVLFEEVRA